MLEGYIFTSMKNFNKSIFEKIQHRSFTFKPVVFVGLFFLSVSAFSYNSDIQQCVDKIDPAERLSCYDSFFKEKKPKQEALIIPKKQEAIKIDEQKEKDYGLEKPKEDFSLTAKIVNVSKRGNYKIYINLDNNQTWRSVKDFYDRVPVSKGQTVSISEGFISGYVMKVEGKKTSLRVRRVK